MVIDTVDRVDSVIGAIPRRDVLATGDAFRVVHVFVYNSRGEILLQQIGANRDRHPLRWGSSVAGYLFSGEQYEDAAQRRLQQELSISGFTLSLRSKTSIMDGNCLKFISLFTTTHDGPFQPDLTHIQQIAFFSVTEVKKMINTSPQDFAPTSLELLTRFLP